MKELTGADPPSAEVRGFVKARVEALDREVEPPAPPPGLTITTRRGPDLTDSLIDEIRKRMVTGVPAERAAQSLGVMPRAFRRWVSYGQAGLSELHVRLVEVVDRADAEFEVAAMAAVQQGKAGWQSKAWALERRFQERYALRIKQEHSGPAGGPILIAPGRAMLPPEDPE